MINPATPGAYHVDTPGPFVAPMTPGSGGAYDQYVAPSPYMGGGFEANNFNNAGGAIESIRKLLCNVIIIE